MYEKSVGGKICPEKNLFVQISKYIDLVSGFCRCSAFCCCALFGCALCGFDFAALTGFYTFCGVLYLFSACGCSRSILGFLRAVFRPAFPLYGVIITAFRGFPCCCVSYCLIGLLYIAVWAFIPLRAVCPSMGYICPFSAIPACGGLLSVRAALRSVNVLSASYAVKPRARVGRAVVLPRGCVWFYAFILSAALLAACSVV